MRRSPMLTAAAALAAWLCLTPVPGSAGDKETADQMFIREANAINLTEMKVGKLAQDNGGSDVIKKFGERTMRDHTSMNMNLITLASKKGVVLATQLDKKHQGLVDQLSKLRGPEFDRLYAKDMTVGHKHAIKLFEGEIKNGQDAEVKDYAAKWLPALREHLSLAENAVKEVKGEK